MKKLTLLFWFIFLQLFCLNAQVGMTWGSCYGGVEPDWANSIQQTSDGGFVVAGGTNSNDGDVTGNHGQTDFWVIKLNTSGILEWQECLGGSNGEWANSIQQTIDGGYVIAGQTNSYDGDVTSNHGQDDFWVVKLNASGILEWEKCLGGSGNDIANSIQQTTDGGFVIAGQSNSNDGDVTGNHGQDDFWVVKLSTSGDIEWQKCFGGSSSESAYSIQQTTDAGYVIAGQTSSNDGDVTGNNGQVDFWVIKLNTIGILEWQKCLGDSSNDEAKSIQQTIHGGFVVVGASGHSPPFAGNADFLAVKLDVNGVIEWQERFGGNNFDGANSIQQTTDGGFVIAGQSNSNDGDVTGNHGQDDFWVVKLSTSGDIEWQKCLGGSNGDVAKIIQQTTGGGFVVAGITSSNDGDVTGNHGGLMNDFWVVKLCDSDPLTIELQNPEDCYNTLNATDGFNSYLWSTGETSQSINITTGGEYSVTAYNEAGCMSETEINVPNPTPLPISIDVSNHYYCYNTELTAIGNFDIYLWSSGETTQSIIISNGGNYSVTAVNVTNCTSETEIDAPYPLEPYDQSQICMVTLDEEIEKNAIIYEPVLNVGIDSILFYRLNNQTSEYEWLGSNSIDEASVFIDDRSNPDQQNYQYKIAIKDTCSKTSEMSVMHRTMLLQANTGINNEVNLFWNAYTGFDYPNFGIYRSVDGGEYFLIANVPNNTFTYTDLTPPTSEKRYQIRVEKDPPCNPIKSTYSFVGSNPVVLQPDGITDNELQNIKVYPNPFNDKLIIECVQTHESMNIELIDVYGRIVGTFVLKSGQTTSTIETSSLLPGVYYLRFNQKLLRRVVKIN